MLRKWPPLPPSCLPLPPTCGHLASLWLKHSHSPPPRSLLITPLNRSFPLRFPNHSLTLLVSRFIVNPNVAGPLLKSPPGSAVSRSPLLPLLLQPRSPLPGPPPPLLQARALVSPLPLLPFLLSPYPCPQSRPFLSPSFPLLPLPVCPSQSP